MIKPLPELLRKAYHEYTKKRGMIPTKFSIGIEYNYEMLLNILLFISKNGYKI